MRTWIWLLLLALVLTACGSPEPEGTLPVPPETAPDVTEETVPAYPQLMARAESREAAEEIARLYGIALVKYRGGLAAFYTEEDPAAVMARREDGWPELYRNQVAEAS